MTHKFTLRDRQFVGVDLLRTTYETNIDIRRHTNIDMLKSSIKEGVCLNLGIAKAEDVSMDFTVCLKSELALKYPDKYYTLVIHESGAITRLPDSFRVDAK